MILIPDAMILLIDNYDSFVYNLARYFGELGCETELVRNDAVTVATIRERQPAAIVLSPGPCTPQDSGVCVDVVAALGADVPILGVCLGHQAIATAFGARVVRAGHPVHGRTSLVNHHGEGLFEGLPNPLTATRYHSLIVDEPSLPESLVVTAHTEDEVMMALQHRERPIYGVQFHPESILTSGGHQLLSNFLGLAGIVSTYSPAAELLTKSDAEDDFYRQSIFRDHPPPPPAPTGEITRRASV